MKRFFLSPLVVAATFAAGTAMAQQFDDAQSYGVQERDSVTYQEPLARTDHQTPTAPRNSIAAQVAPSPTAVNTTAGIPAKPAVRTARRRVGVVRPPTSAATLPD